MFTVYSTQHYIGFTDTGQCFHGLLSALNRSNILKEVTLSICGKHLVSCVKPKKYSCKH